MPTSTTNGDAKDFEVGPRTLMGVDALAAEERRTVEEAIRSKAAFLARIADANEVFRLRPNSPYCALKVTPSLRLIYTRDGDRIFVEDLVNQGIIDLFSSTDDDTAGRSSRRRSTSDRSRRRGSREGLE